MQEANSSTLNTFLCGCSAFFLSMYVFCAHFNYPFSQTLLLYIGVLFAAVLLLSGLKVPISKTVNVYIIILLITAMGCIYTNDAILARRQFTFFAIYGIILWLAVKNERFVEISRKLMYIFSLIGMVTVYIQFFIPGPFNILTQKLFRAKTYENILWSYNVDGSFTGLTPSVSMASFSMAIIFFISADKVIKYFFRINDEIENGPKHVDYLALVLMILSVLGIVLTNKRGIFLAVVLAFVLSSILDKNISIKKLSNTRFLVLCFLVLIVAIVGFFLLSGNEQIVHFIARFQDNSKGLLTGRGEYYSRAIADFSNGSIFTTFLGKGTAAAYAINSTGIHNVYLQILYDHGVLGLIVYLCFFIGNLGYAIKNRYYYSMSLQIVFLAYCMSGNPLYDYFFFIPYLINTQYKG